MKLPFWFHPTTTILIDDNQRFLHGVEYTLSKRYLLHSESKPQEALQTIEKATQVDNLTGYANIASAVQGDSVDYERLLQNLTAISTDPNRFEIISSVISDYEMPGMNGIEFCKKLSSSPLAKIILTGEADESIAVKAFNAKIIDKFILKNTENLANKLSEILQEAQQNYFLSLSRSLISDKIISTHPYLAFLASDNFKNTFEAIVEKYNITEYYLLDTNGLFRLMNKEGKHSWLNVLSQTRIDNLLSLIDASDEVPAHLLQQVTSKTHFPCFKNEEDLNLAPCEWEAIMYPVTERVHDSTDYYICHICSEGS